MKLSSSEIERVYQEAIPSLKKRKGSEATGLCPFHDDRDASFSVNLDKGVWICHAGCGSGNTFEFVAKKEEVHVKEVDQILHRRFGVTQKEQPNVGQRQVLRRYCWQDAAGHEAWKLRLDNGRYKFIWAEDSEGRRLGKGACQPTLFGLSAVASTTDIILVEGERDAETVNDWLNLLGVHNLRATCTPNGAGDVKAAFLAPLSRKVRVYLSGDNDRAGHEYVEKCGTLLTGQVECLRRMLVPQGAKDWTEWRERGGTAEAFRQRLDQATAFVLTARESARWETPLPKEVKDTSSPADVAEAFLENTEYLNEHGLFLRWHQSQWHGYDGKVFCPVRTEDLKAEVIAFLHRTPAKAKARGSFVSDVLLNLGSLCRMTPPSVTLPAHWISPNECVSRPKSIVVQNGIVDLAELFMGEIEDVLTDHTPDFVSTVCLPFKFDPKALCPRWDAFLEQVLPDPESRQLLQEIFGYCLTYDTSQQKFFMFEGTGGNGKGVVLRILTLLLGEKNISSLPLESFSEKHDLVATQGKLVNITSEVGDLDKVGEGLLKQFTGEDLMHFNPKYREPFSAKPTARLVLATNVRPPFKDKSDGLWRRLIVLPFPMTISEEERNPHLTEDLATELSGIFNWAVWGAWNLHERGGFIEPASSRQARETFQREANPARLFLEEGYEARPDGELNKQTLYGRYRDYCQNHGHKPLNAPNFGKEVERLFPRATITRPRRDGSRDQRYKGIAARGREGQEGMDGGNRAA